MTDYLPQTLSSKTCLTRGTKDIENSNFLKETLLCWWSLMGMVLGDPHSMDKAPILLSSRGMALTPTESRFSLVIVGMGMLKPVATNRCQASLKSGAKRRCWAAESCWDRLDSVQEVDDVSNGCRCTSVNGASKHARLGGFFSMGVKSWALNGQRDQWDFSVGLEARLKALEGLTKESSINRYCLLLWWHGESLQDALRDFSLRIGLSEYNTSGIQK